MDIRTPAESYSRLPYFLKIGGNSAKNVVVLNKCLGLMWSAREGCTFYHGDFSPSRSASRLIQYLVVPAINPSYIKDILIA